MTYFNIIFKLCILHDYFIDMICPGIQICPDKESLRILNNNQWVFKQTNKNEWVLVGDISRSLTNFLSSSHDIIHLKATISDSRFLYYTDSLLPKSSSDTEIQCHADENSYRSFEITFPITKEMLEEALANHPAEQNLQYASFHRYWEYLLISRTVTDEFKDIYLFDAEGTIAFGATELINWNERKTYCIQSLKPIRLKEHYSTNIQLFEKRVLGKKLLIKNIQPPIPGQFISEKKDTIQQLIYF